MGDADAETCASIDASTMVNVGPSRKRTGVRGIAEELVAAVAAASGASKAPCRERLGVPTPFGVLVVSASASVASGAPSSERIGALGVTEVSIFAVVPGGVASEAPRSERTGVLGRTVTSVASATKAEGGTSSTLRFRCEGLRASCNQLGPSPSSSDENPLPKWRSLASWEVERFCRAGTSILRRLFERA